MLASGTPLENNIQEIWQLVDFCREGMLGNHFKFIDRYMEKDYFDQPIAPKPQMSNNNYGSIIIGPNTGNQTEEIIEDFF